MFAFLDPDGLQLNWETVRALAAHRRTGKIELLILYPYDMAVSRLFSLANTNSAISLKLTTYYGDESWKMQLQQSVNEQESIERRRERFVDLYRSNLKSLGYKFVEVYGPLYAQRGPLYHVIFASHHDVGAKIMGDVWGKTRFIPGELFYRPVRRPGTYRSRLGLG